MSRRDPKALQAEIAWAEARLAELEDERSHVSRHLSELKAELSLVQAAEVDALAREATRKGQIIGVRMGEPADDEDAATPWTRAPSRKGPRPVIPGPLPPSVQAVLSQLLFVETAGLPSALINLIKRLAAFQNPEFYNKQALRLPTALTPRVISCAEDHPQHVGLPRGCADSLEELLSELGVGLSLEDQRTDGHELEVDFHGELTPIQNEVVHAMVEHDIGVFVAPPGSGKTVEQLTTIPETEERLVLATGQFIGEGFDDARLDTLFLAMPVSWKGTLVQYAGRLHRKHHAKTEVRMMDYVDRNVPMLARMFEKRMRGYRAMGYSVGDHAPPDHIEGDYASEYDQVALRELDSEDF